MKFFWPKIKYFFEKKTINAFKQRRSCSGKNSVSIMQCIIHAIVKEGKEGNALVTKFSNPENIKINNVIIHAYVGTRVEDKF